MDDERIRRASRECFAFTIDVSSEPYQQYQHCQQTIDMEQLPPSPPRLHRASGFDTPNFGRFLYSLVEPTVLIASSSPEPDVYDVSYDGSKCSFKLKKIGSNSFRAIYPYERGMTPSPLSIEFGEQAHTPILTH